MKDISRRIISLILALLMVLEVFSPVAVSAALLPEASQNSENDGGYQSKSSILVGPSDDSNSRKENETKVLEVPAKKQVEQEKQANQKSTDRQNNKIQEEKASGSLFEEEKPPVEEKRDKALIEEGTKREKEAEARVKEALRESQEAERKARESEIANQDFAQETIQSGYKSWRVKNKVKALYSGGKIDCQGLLIEVEDFNGKKKTLTYDDILKDKNIIVNKEIKEGLFAPSGKLTLSTTGLKDIEIKIEFDKSVNKSDLSLEKENSNKLEKDNKEEEKEGVLDKIKNFFADEETKGLEEDARGEDAILEFNNQDRKGILIPQPLTPEEEAIGLQTIEEYQEEEEEETPRFMFFRAPALRGPQNNLENKKFTIITRFDVSTKAGPIQAGQSFTVQLDDKLTVKDPQTLKPILNNGKTIATPSYDEKTNSIIYTIAETITEDLQIPLAIDVDYNTNKIKELDKDATKHSIKNSISGIGVTGTVKLPETVVDDEGNVVNQIVEPGSHSVLEIVDQGEDYQVHMDVIGNPIVKDGELDSIDWTVRFTSTKDLLDLGLTSNATLVKGSGLSRYENITINGKPIDSDDITTNEIEGRLGIRESKNHTPQEHTKDVAIRFQTPVFNKQQKYMIDFSVLLKNKNKSGAVRLLFDKGYPDDLVKEKTSKHIGMNNRTTIMGEFTTEDSAKWTVTDGVSTGDVNNGLPLATRDLTGAQELQSSRMAVYTIDTDENSPTCGKMIIKQVETDLNKTIPEKERNPNTAQIPGTIAVYEYDTTLTDSNAGYSMGGVNINKYQDIKIKQTWAGIDSTKKMPAQGFVVQDEKGNVISPEIRVPEGEAGVIEREITIPAAKYWDIKTAQDGSIEESKTSQKVLQNLPGDTTIEGKTYSYKEKYNYLAEEDSAFHIYNVMTESTQETDAGFTILKFDSKEPSKKLSGAKFNLQSPEGNVELETDANGRASFSNVSPGTYTLIESKAPKGYKVDTSVKRITVSNDGKVSVAGDNISMQAGKIETELAHHNYEPNYPSYMNAMHYGKIDGNGNIEFYIYLKPEANGNDGYTNKNTRLNLNVLGGTINSVEVLDVSPDNRNTVRNYMFNQNANEYAGNNLINARVPNDITGNDNITDGFTGKTGYQIKFPAVRFGGQDSDWGFLVKVKAKGSESTAVSYDWLTDNDKVKDEARIQEAIGLSTSSEGGVTLNIGNEPFPKIPVEVTKVRADKEVLSDATFRIKDSNNKIIGDAKSGEDGKASFGELSPGKYTIEEISAPPRYQKSNVIFDVTVGEDGKVTYKARFKDGSGTPKNGVDYVLEEIEAGQGSGKAKIQNVTQSMILQERQTYPNDGRLGNTEGVWEAYGIESYRYKAEFIISNAKQGGLFKIQFDPNLDFRRYVYEIPELKDKSGAVLAKPYFNYETNLLTYQFTRNVDQELITANLEIIGIIPDKYYATQTDTINGYNFRIIVDPDDPETATMTPALSYPNKSTTNSANKIIDVNIKTDYYSYDSQGGDGPLSSEYITEIYKDKNGDTYLKAMTYYNPTGLSSGKRTLRFDWLSMNKPRPGLANYKANGYPAFGFKELEVYKVTDIPINKQRLMPLSYGIRPDQDPRNYDLVYKKSDVNPQEGFRDQIGEYRVTYDPSLLKDTEGLLDYGHNKHPLEIDVPRVGANDGYVVIQTFKVTDEQRFKNLWSAYYFSQGSRHTGSYQKGNSNIAIGSESGQEIPKFYTEKVKLINKTYNPGKFQIQKLNEANRTQKLQGATFSLTDEEGHVIYRSSDADGIVDFTDIEPGTYTLEESKTPQGYEKSNKKWRVTVYETGNVLIREIGITGTGSVTEGTNIQLPVTNKPVAEKFQVYKKNGNGEALQGAEFTIYSKDEKTVIAKGTSDANGIVNFTFEAGKSLEEGKQYVLKETKNPKGYKQLDQKWVLEVKDGKTKVYNYVTSAESSGLTSFLAEDNVNWVDVKNRKTSGWSTYDNRWTGWTGNSQTAQFMGTRIIAINKTKKYAIQRYIINPEARKLGQTTASIHRQDPRDPNMTWYNGNAEYKVFELDKPVTGLISDVRLANYKTKDITATVKATEKRETGKYGEPDRLNLTLPATSKPIVIDVKVPYINDDGGVGTGMDWTADEYGNIYWKADYYENVQDIIVGDPTKAETGDIKGSYVAEGSLDVTNEKDKFQFKLKKVKEGTNEAIKGAVFKLTGPDPLKDERYMTTGADGMITFAGLEAGTYTLEETQPAPGYVKVDTKWTVRIAIDGKVYIKGDKTTTETTESTGSSDSTFSVVDLGSKDTAEAASVNPALAMKMQKIKEAAYGLEDEINRKSLAFKTEADKNEALVKEKLKSVYGPDEIADKYSDLVSIKEMGMAAYAAKKTSADGLEISDETVPQAQRAESDWETIDPARSEKTNLDGKIKRSTDNQVVLETRMTEINKVDKKFRQVFLYGQSTFGDKTRKIHIHSQPEEFDVRANAPNNAIVKVYTVTGSSLDNIGTKTEITNVRFTQKSLNNHFRLINDSIPASVKGNILVEVETYYEVGKGIGLGTDYVSNTTQPRYSTNWIGESYASEDKINYKQETYSVTFGQMVNGSVTANKTADIKENEQITLTVSPKEGYELEELRVNDQVVNVTNNQYTFAMPASNVNVTATFREKQTQYDVVIATLFNGKITANKSKANAGETITLTIEPDTDYELTTLKYTDENGEEHNIDMQGKSFIMPASNVLVQATFTKKGEPQPTKHRIYTNPNGNGRIEVNKTEAAEGEKVTFTPIPDAGNTITSLSVKSGSGQVTIIDGNSFIMPNEDVTINATFKPAQGTAYNIKAIQPQEGGTVTVPTSAKAGDEVTLTATPKEGYVLDKFTVTKDADGSELQVTDGKFTMPAGNVTVTATFKQSETPQPGEGETEIPAGKAVQITNKQVGIELKVYKRNNVNEGLDGAVFTLKKYTDKTFTTVDETFTGLTATSGTDGKVEFKDADGNTVKLQTGYYMLEETKSPIGYKKQAAPWKLQVREKNGSLEIIQKGPEHTAASFLTSDKAVAGDNQSGKIKYKSIIKNIDPTSKTFVQRVYIDTRAYGKEVNVQITPKHKREEIDRPGLPPVTIKEGVKTAYRSTYQITDPPANVDVDKVLNSYDLREQNVTTVNTARWRPFDWGFDEDLLNLEPGVYYIDIEGYYDNSLIDRKVTNEVAIDGNYNFTEKDGRTLSTGPVLKDPYEKTAADIPDGDLGKLDLHIDFYDGARHLEQITGFDGNAQPIYKTFHGASYQGGMISVRNGYYRYLRANGWGEKAATEEANRWANSKSVAGQKYSNALSKEAYLDNDKYIGAKIVPPLTNPVFEADTSADISSLYTSDRVETVPQEGLSITNEREVYNITFSKHSKEEDDNKNRLEGAVFKLQKKEGSFWYDLDESYVSSAFNGYFGFRRLEPGTYRLLEVAPPKGYRAIDGTLLEFVIKTVNPKGETFTKDGNTYDKESGLRVEVQPDGTHKVVDQKTGKIVESANGYVTLEYKNGNYLIPNVKDDETATGKLVDFVTSATAKNIGKVINEEPGKGSVTIKKVDENGNAIPGVKDGSGEFIAGAKFRATRLGAKTDKDGNPVSDAVYEGYVDENGQLILEGLPLGNYELREVESPNGHINTGHVWHFTVGGKTLDPYAEDTSSRVRDITSFITLEKSDMKVERPSNADKTSGNDEIRPHVGQSLQFTNEYKIDEGVKISAGDYFTLKLTDNIDLYGVREDKISGLDLFSDGVGTIAKADYNRQAGTITYTFTKAAEQYTILDFKNVITAHINLNKVKNSGQEVVGMSIGNDTSKHKDIYVNYIVDTEKDDDGYNFINMASKIVSFNTETGEFVHYFYINRLGEYDGRSLTFGYMPNRNVSNLQITTYDLNYTDDYWKNYSMPASFGVNENDRNLRNSKTTQPTTATANVYTTTELGSFPNNRAAIVKVTGKVDTKDMTEFRGNSALYSNGYWSTDGYYKYWHEPIGVYRWDGVYVFENQNTADAKFELKITNPANKVVFEKVDPQGETLKPTIVDGKITDGAMFILAKNDGTIENPSANWTSVTDPTYVDKDGRIAYDHLEKGLYRVTEFQAPKGYAKPDDAVAYLKVDESGKIYHKVTVQKEDGSGTEEIYQEVNGTIPIKIVNKKPIEFVKVDADNNKNFLKDAIFELYYKEKETDKYAKYLDKENKEVKVTSDESGKFSLAVSKDGYYALKEIKAPAGYSIFPGYIKEFKLKNGKLQVLEKSSKQGTVQSDNNIISSQTIEINEKDRTFKQRIILNPNQKEWHFDGGDTQLRLYEDQWTVNTDGKKIRYAVLDEDKSISDLKEGDFKEFDPRNSSAKPLMYAVARMYGENNYTKPSTTNSEIYTNKSLVVEFTGKLEDSVTSPISIKMDVNSDQWKYSELTYSLDYDKIVKEDKIYVDYESKDPIKVENRKGEYPHTGGMGTLIFTVTGLVLMTAAAYVYSRKRRGSYDD